MQDVVDQQRVQHEPASLHVHLKTSTSLDKYPAREHARRVVDELPEDLSDKLSDELLEELPEELPINEGLIYLPGAPTRDLEDSDQPRPLRQRRYFAYLTGCDEADCHVTYDIASEKLILWLPPIDPRRAMWVGRGSTVEEAREKYDVDEAAYSDSLEMYIQSFLKSGHGKVYVLHPDQVPAVCEGSPRLDFDELGPAIDYCRVVKDSHEIALIRKANEISTQAHTQVLRNIRKLNNEAQVEAMFLEVCVSNDAKHQAYEIIAGSGDNASVLHYVKNNEPFGDRQLMCLDAGAEWQLYASDVTRTFPLSGYWPSQEAKDIYHLVERMQTRCLNYLGPEKRFVNAHYLAHATALQGLLELGILRGSYAEIFEAGTQMAFFPHGLGHHLGLEVHDVPPRPSNEPAVEEVDQEMLFRATNSDRQDCQMRLIMLEEESNRIRLLSAKLELDRCVEDLKPHLDNNADMVDHAECLRTLGQSTLQLDPNAHLCQFSAPILEPGMVVTVEPGIYFNRYALEQIYLKSPKHSKFINKEVLDRYMGVGGVRIEDDILITEQGWENLTTAPKGEEALRIIRGEAW